MIASSSNPLVLIAAGGTGGHVFPGLAVAEILESRNISVMWVGTRKGIEARVVPAAGIPIKWLHVTGLRGKGFLQTLTAPLKLFYSLIVSLVILLKYKPNVILGMGGFVTGPIGLAARLLGKPLVLHEQNAIPGMTNRWLSKVATCVMQAFPGAFAPAINAQTVGNPLRKGIGASPQITSDNNEFHILAVGGSLGARFINDILPQTLAQISNKSNYILRHQTGRNNQSTVADTYKKLGLSDSVVVDEFIVNMQEAYQWADLVICRAGAMTVSELAASGTPSILVPFPFAVDDHQTSNAMFLVNSGAAVIMQQNEIDKEKLGQQIVALSDHTLLRKMSEKAREVSVLDAGEKIADVLQELAA